MTRDEALAKGRAAHGANAWSAARSHLAHADGQEPLGPPDLELLAEAAFLAGHEQEAIAAWTRAHRAWLAEGLTARAVRPAFWITLTLELRGDEAQAGGWLARAERLVDEAGSDCVEAGYLLFLVGMGQLLGGDPSSASASLQQATNLGRRFDDPDLLAFALMGSGQSLIWLGQSADGLALLDEAMVSVTAGEVSPIAAGLVYCALIEACHDSFDVRRAREWTRALTDWCAAQPISSPTAAPASSTGPRSCCCEGSGTMRARRRRTLRSIWRASRPPATPTTSGPRSTGCGAKPSRPRRPTDWRVTWAAPPNRV
ncbi:MAG: hypothetical protein ACLGI2_03295 [Acidimicrobiia bacterium]